MPRGDKTGPTGAGRGTGRTKGFCLGFGIPGTFNRSQNFVSPGRGGGGQRRRNRFFNTGMYRMATFGRLWFRAWELVSLLTPGSALDLEPGPQLETLKANGRNILKKSWRESNGVYRSWNQEPKRISRFN